MEMIEYAIGPFLCRTRNVGSSPGSFDQATVAIDRRAQKIPMLSCDKAYPYNFYFRLSTVAEVEIFGSSSKSGGPKVSGPFRLKQLSDLSFSSRFRFFY